MPDISLLQREYYGPEEEESRTPGIVSTAALVLFLVSIAAYVGLFFYSGLLVSRQEEIDQKIDELNIEQHTETLGELKAVGTQARTLTALRQGHTYSTELFRYLEQSTHPRAYFANAQIDLRKKKEVAMKGYIPTPTMLARQIDGYVKDRTDGRIAGFEVEGVKYAEKKAVTFSLKLTFPK